MVLCVALAGMLKICDIWYCALYSMINNDTLWSNNSIVHQLICFIIFYVYVLNCIFSVDHQHAKHHGHHAKAHSGHRARLHHGHLSRHHAARALSGYFVVTCKQICSGNYASNFVFYTFKKQTNLHWSLYTALVNNFR